MFLTKKYFHGVLKDLARIKLYKKWKKLSQLII